MSEDTAKKKYQWFAWWGNDSYEQKVYSDDSPEIGKKLLAIRRAVGGLEARKSEEAYGPKFPVKSAKELMLKLREAIDKEKCHVIVHDLSIQVPQLDQIPPNGKGAVFRSAATATIRVRICAPDGSYVESMGAGGAGDGDDKAVGKATTYAWKDAVVKALSLPDADLSDSDSDSDHGEVPQPTEGFEEVLRKIPGMVKEDLQDVAAMAKKSYQPHEKKAVSDAIKARLAKLKEEENQ